MAKNKTVIVKHSAVGPSVAISLKNMEDMINLAVDTAGGQEFVWVDGVHYETGSRELTKYLKTKYANIK